MHRGLAALENVPVKIYSFAIHGRFEIPNELPLRPGAFFGVAFMNLDQEGRKDQVSEGLDRGLSVRVGRLRGPSALLEFVRRGQSVLVPGAGVESGRSSWLWSHGLRLGVGVGF